MWILLLAPFALLALSQVLALVAFAQAASGTGASSAALAVPLIAYATAMLLSISAVVLAALPSRLAEPAPREVLIAFAALASLMVCAAPLLWGRTIGEFHLSHHLVRAALVAICLVLYSWYVASHR
ncbi:hypothetical protein ACXET9_15835 [Brachybacterium sp. DNPG3]